MIHSRSTKLYCIIAVCAILSVCLGETLLATPSVNKIALPVSQFNHSAIVAHANETSDTDPASGDNADNTKAGAAVTKSPLKAGLLSFVLPGAGQYYSCSSPIKVGAFLGLEAGLWYGVMHYDNQGKDRIVEFQDYANQYWNQDEYRRYLDSVYNTTVDTGAGFTHALPATPTQQYYEMIGKYDQFSYGWAPFDSIDYTTNTASYEFSSNPYPSERRTLYNKMRAGANTSFSNRDKLFYAAVFNHVAAAVDAIMAAKRFNKKISVAGGDLSFAPRLKTYRQNRQYSFAGELRVQWRF